MNNFKFSIFEDYDVKELTGTNNRETITYNIQYRKLMLNDLPYIIKHKDTLTIDNIADNYGLTIYYHRGEYSDNRIVKICILPIYILYGNNKYEGYLLFGNINNHDIYRPTVYCKNLKNFNYPYTLYDNPTEAGKEYININLNIWLDKYNNANDLITNYDNTIEEKIKEIKDKYNKLMFDDIKAIKSEYTNKLDEAKATKELACKFYNKYKDYAITLNLDITKYNELENG